MPIKNAFIMNSKDEKKFITKSKTTFNISAEIIWLFEKYCLILE